MKKMVLWVVGMLFLSFVVVSVFAEEQPSNQEPNQRPEPNKLQDANVQPGAMTQQVQIQQMREQTRQRIRERIEQRRKEGTRRPIGPGRAMDMNLVTRVTDKNSVEGPRPIIDANQLQRQSMTLEQLISQEEAKYRDRLARLNRIRELAEQQGDTETAARVDKLLSQDQQIHQAKAQRMASRKEKIAEYAERLKSMKDVNDVNKPVGQPRVNKK